MFEGAAESSRWGKSGGPRLLLGLAVANEQQHSRVWCWSLLHGVLSVSSARAFHWVQGSSTPVEQQQKTSNRWWEKATCLHGIDVSLQHSRAAGHQDQMLHMPWSAHNACSPL